MDLLASGLKNPAYGSANYLALFFSGAVPETQDAMPFNSMDLDHMFQAPEFIGTKNLSSTDINKGRFGQDGCELVSDLQNSHSMQVPVGHVEFVGNEILHLPKTWKYIYPETENAGGLLDNIYRGTGAYTTYNVLMMSRLTDSSSYGFMYGNSNTDDFLIQEHGLELTFENKFVMSRQYSYGLNSNSYYNYFEIKGWDYDTESWVSLNKGAHTSNSSINNVLDDNTLSTDKYFMTRYNKGNSTTRAGFSRLNFFSKAEDYVAPAEPQVQPTWVMLYPWSTQGQGSPAFVWGSCSGPLGEGEFKVNDDNFKRGDSIQLLTRQFEVFSLFEGVSNEG